MKNNSKRKKKSVEVLPRYAAVAELVDEEFCTVTLFTFLYFPFFSEKNLLSAKLYINN